MHYYIYSGYGVRVRVGAKAHITIPIERFLYLCLRGQREGQKFLS